MNPRAIIVLSAVALATGTLFLAYATALAHAAHTLAHTGGLQ